MIVHWFTKSVYENYFECKNKNKTKKFTYTTCSELVVFMHWTVKSMYYNLLSYCGLVGERVSASEKDLSVCASFN